MPHLTPEHKQHFSREGWLLLQAIPDPSEIAELKSEVLRLIEDDKTLRADDPVFQIKNRSTHFSVGLHHRSSKISEFVRRDLFGEVCENVLGPGWELIAVTTITKMNGKGGPIDWHQDIAYDPKKRPSVVCWTALTEANPANGGLFIIPGSHLSGERPHAKSPLCERDLQTLGIDAKDSVPIEMKAGETLVIDRFLVHGSVANTSDAPRIALLGVYHKKDAS